MYICGLKYGGWNTPPTFELKIWKLLKMIRVNNEQYLTLQEYAKRENVTIQTVYNWIKNKKVETKKIMNMTLIKCWFFLALNFWRTLKIKLWKDL